jgi:2-(1,2-epoxy-1,2-dihydrophenyl)acetyl-CoA isomerase
MQIARVAGHSPVAARMAKGLFRLTCHKTLEQALDAEAAAAAGAAATEDFVEAIVAFIGKRSPHFTGR